MKFSINTAILSVVFFLVSFTALSAQTTMSNYWGIGDQVGTIQIAMETLQLEEREYVSIDGETYTSNTLLLAKESNGLVTVFIAKDGKKTVKMGTGFYRPVSKTKDGVSFTDFRMVFGTSKTTPKENTTEI